MSKNRKALIAVSCCLLFGMHSANAVPILSGSFSITGNFLAVNAVTGALTSLSTASGIDFIALGGSTPTPGTPGQFLVNSAAGNFSSLVGQIGAIRDFAFASTGSAAFPNPNFAGPLLAFQNVGGLTFTLNSLAAPLLQTNSVLALTGEGVFNMVGFAPTLGTFDFTGNGAGGTFSFSASNGTVSVPVPEPATLSILGIGLLCIALTTRRGRNHRRLSHRAIW